MNAIEVTQILDDYDFEAYLNATEPLVIISEWRCFPGRVLRSTDYQMFTRLRLAYSKTLPPKFMCGDCGSSFDTASDAEECCLRF